MPSAGSLKYEEQILRAKIPETNGSNTQGDILTVINSLSKEEKQEFIVQLLAREIGTILHIPPEKVDQHKPVFELGMDSLMGVELALAIEEKLAIKLPLMSLAEGATIAKLATKVIDLIQGTEFSDAEDKIQAFASRHEDNLENIGISKDVAKKLIAKYA